MGPMRLTRAVPKARESSVFGRPPVEQRKNAGPPNRGGTVSGNCTRSPLDATFFRERVCENRRLSLSKGCREDEALRELVATWH